MTKDELIAVLLEDMKTNLLAFGRKVAVLLAPAMEHQFKQAMFELGRSIHMDITARVDAFANQQGEKDHE